MSATATYTESSSAPDFWIQCTVKGPTGKYLEIVSDLVDSRRHKRYALQNPPGSVLRIAALEDTIYRDEPDEVKEWGMFYLPEVVNMKVIGVVEGSPCPSDELVLMTCEDKRLYAFDGEELHVVGSGLDWLKQWGIKYPQDATYYDGKELHVVDLGLHQLQNWGIKYPSDETYYDGEAFKDMTKEDWEEVKRGDVGKQLEKEHKKLVESHKSKFLENLQSQK